MIPHNEIQLMLYEYLRDELTTADHSTVESHLSSCKECSEELASLRETLTLLPTLATLPSDERTEEFWHALPASVAAKTGREKIASGNPITILVDWIEETLALHPRHAYAVGGTIVVALVTFAFWTFFPRPQQDIAEHVTTAKPLEHTLAPTELIESEQSHVPLQRVNQYFRKSKTLLVGLTNMKTDQGEPFDFSAERRVSHDLIREARYLKLQPLDARSRQLMSDLDRILIEVANTEENTDLPNIDIIRGGIHQENLLFKIRMAEAMYDSTQFMYTSERR